MEKITGKIIDIRERSGEIIIAASYDNFDRLILRKNDEAEIFLPDKRAISPEQRRKAHAMLAEIADWAGEMPDYIKRLTKFEFIASRMEDVARRFFSLSDCDMTTAREYITFLIDFMLEHDVPSKVPLYELCDDINRYVYSCLMRKRCVVCGKKADLHHFDAIGMGRNRDNIYQIGMRVISLCREHHQEAHSKGRSWITDDLHLVPIPLTVEIGKQYRLTKKNLQEAAQ